MPVTDNSKIIQKYVPEKHIVGSSVEVDNSGYLLLRDNFISVFPSIMEYKEKTPFGEQEVVVKLRWCAYVVFNGFVMLFISKNGSISSLKEEIENSNYNLWGVIPAWYSTILSEKEGVINQNVWNTFLDKDIIMYLKLQQEYGFMQGEIKSDKMLLFPKTYTNQQYFTDTLSMILKDKVLRGEMTQQQLKEILQNAKPKN